MAFKVINYVDWPVCLRMRVLVTNLQNFFDYSNDKNKLGQMRRVFRAALQIPAKEYSQLFDCLELAKMPERPNRCPNLFFNSYMFIAFCLTCFTSSFTPDEKYEPQKMNKQGMTTVTKTRKMMTRQGDGENVSGIPAMGKSAYLSGYNCLSHLEQLLWEC